jgi:putative endonuclease
MRQYYLYFLASKTKVLYIGVTNNLERRLYEHKHKIVKGFTSKYNVNRLVYYEVYSDIRYAIAREKQLKAGPRRKKVELIEKENKDWRDLTEDWQ